MTLTKPEQVEEAKKIFKGIPTLVNIKNKEVKRLERTRTNQPQSSAMVQFHEWSQATKEQDVWLYTSQGKGSTPGDRQGYRPQILFQNIWLYQTGNLHNNATMLKLINIIDEKVRVGTTGTKTAWTCWLPLWTDPRLTPMTWSSHSTSCWTKQLTITIRNLMISAIRKSTARWPRRCTTHTQTSTKKTSWVSKGLHKLGKDHPQNQALSRQNASGPEPTFSD